jgi:hypothetical protein
MLYLEVTESMFINIMAKPEHGFSYYGAIALFEYLYMESDEYNMELDAVGLRCTYDEYDNIQDVIRNFPNTFDWFIEELEEEGLTLDEVDEDRLFEIVRDETVVIRFNRGVIIESL